MVQSVNERIQERLSTIRDYPQYYEPNSDTRNEIRHKDLVMLIGPCAVGKSYVIDTLTSTDDHYGKVRSISTRDPRPDDTPETMRCFAWNNEEIGELCTLIEQGDFVNYTFHPKTGDLYGTLRDSYPAPINVLPTLATSVANIATLPFRRTHAIGLVTSPDAWRQWFEQRSFSSPKDRAGRIAEAALSLEWLLDHSEASIVSNTPHNPTDASDAIRRVVSTRHTERDEPEAEALLSYIHSLQ